MDKITLKPIGYIKNDINSHQELMDISPSGVKSSLIIYEEYVEGLRRIDKCSHIMVLCYLDRSTKSPLTINYRKFGIEDKTRGVFATRSPARPNHIAVTVTKLLEIKNNELIVERMDMFNNTPILDIKSYSEGMDLVFNTRSLNEKMDYYRAPKKELYSYFKDMILNFSYNIDESLDLGLNSIIKIAKTIDKIPDREILESIETDYTGTALDTLYYFTKYTPGENKIQFKNIDNSRNSYIKLKLKNGEIWELLNNNNLLEMNKLN